MFMTGSMSRGRQLSLVAPFRTAGGRLGDRHNAAMVHTISR